jgi:hypothetical protein
LRQDPSVPLSVPDLMLVGHAADAEYALGVATPAPLVASGGRDKDARARPVAAACPPARLWTATALADL